MVKAQLCSPMGVLTINQNLLCECLFVSGSMWRLSALIGVRTIRRREEDPHHVPAEGAVWRWGGEASHRASDHRGERANIEILHYTPAVSPDISTQSSLVYHGLKSCKNEYWCALKIEQTHHSENQQISAASETVCHHNFMENIHMLHF